MDELDIRLRELAKQETLPLPKEYDTMMDRLCGEVRQGTVENCAVKHRWPGKRMLVLAAVIGLLACVACSAAVVWQGWLDPVVAYGDNGDLVETYSVEVGQAVAGEHCDLTLDNVVTDGHVIYCRFTARYDEEFPDMDEAIRYVGVLPGDNNAGILASWRLDDGSIPGIAQFMVATGMSIGPDSVISYLGDELELQAYFLDDAATGIMEKIETYSYTVQLNDTIPKRQMLWGGGTGASVTPLMLEIAFAQEMPDSWEGREALWGRQDCVLEFADGSRFTLDDALVQRIQGSEWRLEMAWDQKTPDGRQDTGICRLWVLFPELIDPETVTAVTINGARYAFP